MSSQAKQAIDLVEIDAIESSKMRIRALQMWLIKGIAKLEKDQ